MAKNKLKVGEEAPVFKADSYNQGSINLTELIGKQKIILIFSRYFGCPICQLDLKELMERLPEIEERGAKILYITQSGKEIAQDFIEEEDISFPVIPGTLIEGTKNDYTIYKDYGFCKMNAGTATKVPLKLRSAKKEGIEHGEYEGYEYQCPGQVVIAEDGKIIQIEKGWLDIDKLIEVL